MQVTGGVSSESLGYGEWGVDDTSGECRIDDRGYDAIGTGNVSGEHVAGNGSARLLVR